MLIQPQDRIVFYGDSITDAGRNREQETHLGNGYAHFIGARLKAKFPQFDLYTANKGISGNRIYDLEDRLEADVLALKPTLVSILIGINDTWRKYDSGIESPIPAFRAAYARILDRLAAAGSRAVLLEPFLLPQPADRAKWREDLDPRITVVRDLAWERRLPLLPLDGLFASAATGTGFPYWLPDGVHPSPAGHGLIAQKWLELAGAD
ncbi:GDSL family lipase [Verrucomicrobia bacterium LW23]|nr:GDSL family lipase [Verrucomicrobia bacterium LW23]PTY04335.1 GDSL family lipase [Verrucomicrobia bacterium LW23]